MRSSVNNIIGMTALLAGSMLEDYKSPFSPKKRNKASMGKKAKKNLQKNKMQRKSRKINRSKK